MIHAFVLISLILLLTGCVSTGGPVLAPCDACIGPYDVGLSSHREALGLKP